MPTTSSILSLPPEALLSSLIGGTQAKERAERLLKDLPNLQALRHLSEEDLAQKEYLSPKMAQRIFHGVALGQQTLQAPSPKDSITRPEQVYDMLQAELSTDADEQLIALFLNRRKHLIQTSHLTRGTDWMTIVDPRQIFHKALLSRANSFILVHNHPSGDPSPSQQDLQITEQIAKMGKLLQLPLLDHIVIGGDSFVSIASLGLLKV